MSPYGSKNASYPKHYVDDPLSKLFFELKKFSSWGTKGEHEVQEIKNKILSLAPNEKNRVDNVIRLGRLAYDYHEKAYRCGTHGEPESALRDLQSKMMNDGLDDFAITKAGEKYKRGALAFQKGSGGMEELVKKNELSFCKHKPNLVSTLRSADQWTVLFDETGSEFDDLANTDGLQDNKIGKGVMLIVPEYVSLPDLPGKWHAVDQGATEIMRVIQQIYKSDCGLLGIPCTALGKIHSDHWFSCIETLLDLILRLLPVDGPTKIDLKVEQRGSDATRENNILLAKTCRDALHHLSRVDPERAEAIQIDSEIISKDMHPWNGYVDAAAYLWSSTSCESLLKITNWVDTCFLGSTYVDNLRYCLDCFARKSTIHPDHWSEIISKALSQHKNSLLHDFLRCVGEQAQKNVGLWEQYLYHTTVYLNAKAINMPILSAKIAWLQEWLPADCALPPRLRLLWLTAKLAEENHRGCIDTCPDQRQEFITLSEQLYEEDAPLTCNAALNLAVSYTDEFDFEGAKRILAPWRGRPAVIPGLQYYGRLQSSFGQHEAFLGNNVEAIQYFRKAIESFKRLSEIDDANLDIQQTSAFLLTSLMDCLPNSTNEFYKEAEAFFNGKIDEAARRLSTSTDDKSKYHHHIMLRYLTSPTATLDERRAYLLFSKEWDAGPGHPWEMIEFYRSLLVDSPAEKLKHLQNAYEIAMTGKGVMHVIAAVVLGSIFLIQPGKEQGYLTLVNRCADSIPALGERVKILREHVKCKYKPLELAGLVLPFNFR